MYKMEYRMMKTQKRNLDHEEAPCDEENDFVDLSTCVTNFVEAKVECR